ncbi:hypothetical protein WY13_00141 [Clostridium ljungdahlii]|uniref:Uncharacterized protein n=1 Tax=Clostridium ljungdahlii TaxID=1538 RepID=A0A162L836_9CLOT|nr:hypothetical protein WY13_00141 [Clostridium ljungdahlii]
MSEMTGAVSASAIAAKKSYHHNFLKKVYQLLYFQVLCMDFIQHFCH